MPIHVGEDLLLIQLGEEEKDRAGKESAQGQIFRKESISILEEEKKGL